MGQKVHPYSLRLGINKGWKSRWYVNPKDYARVLHEDIRIRRVILQLPEAKAADVSDIEIVRHPQKVSVTIHTSHPGVFIGAKGVNIEKIGNDIYKKVGIRCSLKVKEIKRAEADAQCVALSIAKQLKGRSSFRRVLKMAISGAVKAGVQGIKIKISGRLGGAEMARSVEMKEGRVPLQTLRADIDYGFAEVNTTYGILGVKVWICKGEVLKKERKEEQVREELYASSRGKSSVSSSDDKQKNPKKYVRISKEAKKELEVGAGSEGEESLTSAKKSSSRKKNEDAQTEASGQKDSAVKKTARKKSVKEADDAKSQ